MRAVLLVLASLAVVFGLTIYINDGQEKTVLLSVLGVAITALANLIMVFKLGENKANELKGDAITLSKLLEYLLILLLVWAIFYFSVSDIGEGYSNYLKWVKMAFVNLAWFAAIGAGIGAGFKLPHLAITTRISDAEEANKDDFISILVFVLSVLAVTFYLDSGQTYWFSRSFLLSVVLMILLAISVTVLACWSKNGAIASNAIVITVAVAIYFNVIIFGLYYLEHPFGKEIVMMIDYAIDWMF